MKSRFDFVAFSDAAKQQDVWLTATAQKMEARINALPDGREKALALTKLEETVMWARKALRDHLNLSATAKEGEMAFRFSRPITLQPLTPRQAEGLYEALTLAKQDASQDEWEDLKPIYDQLKAGAEKR